jgi:hypothetical protein
MKWKEFERNSRVSAPGVSPENIFQTANPFAQYAPLWDEDSHIGSSLSGSRYVYSKCWQ